MDDPILTSRLEALHTNLAAVSRNLKSPVWQLEPEAGKSRPRAEFFGESDLWLVLQDRARAIELGQKDVDKLKKELAAAPADDVEALRGLWARYTAITNDCQALLREGLEVIGTLAIRQKDLDGNALSIADELIKECLLHCISDQNYYLLVHGMSDTISRTKARIIRLRFPEWTIWDLPLAVHELGDNVVVAAILAAEREENETRQYLTRLLADQRQVLLQRDDTLRQKQEAGGDEAAQAQRWAEQRARALAADAFAAYTLGPAYAYSAVRLRLSPFAHAQRERPSGVQRAQVILSMLEWLNSRQKQMARPYADDIATLGAEWRQTCDRAGACCTLSDDEAQELAAFTKRFADEVGEYSLMPTAMYPRHDKDQGWSRAQEWAEDWLAQWKERAGELQLPANRVGRLRDVLNATWLFRRVTDSLAASEPNVPPEAHLRHPLIARAGQQLCAEIVARKRAPRAIETGRFAAPGGSP